MRMVSLFLAIDFIMIFEVINPARARRIYLKTVILKRKCTKMNKTAAITVENGKEFFLFFMQTPCCIKRYNIYYYTIE